MLDGLLYDVRFALRQLRRERAFTLAAIAMLALALGLNATVFTVMDAVLFRGMPLAKRSDRSGPHQHAQDVGPVDGVVGGLRGVARSGAGVRGSRLTITPAERAFR